MPNESFIWWFFNDAKKPLYVDSNNHVQEGNHETLLKPDGYPAKLKHSPQGWRDILVKYFRNIKYWGLTRDMTVPMKFVGDGATILRHHMWTYGMESVLHLAISKLDRLNHPDVYKAWYKSEVNLSKLRQVRGGVNVEAMEGGMSKFFKAYENTVYEIPVDDPEAFYVKMDGMEFDFQRVFSLMTDQACYGTDNFYLGMVETSREGNAPDVSFQDVIFKPSFAYPNDNWFNLYDQLLATNPSVDIRIHGTVKVYYDKSVTPIIRTEVNDGVGAGSTQTVLWSVAGTAGQTVDAIIDSTITVPAGSRAHIKLLGGSGVDSTTQFTILEGELKVDYVYRYKTTYVKCITLYRLLQLIVEKMTAGKYTVSSTWLSNKLDIAVTCGDALRGLTATFFKTTLSDFFKSVNRWSASLGIQNDILTIERFADVFLSTTSVTLGEVSDLEITMAEDIIFNTIKAGGQKVDYTDVNGKYESNQGQQWSTPYKKIVRELDLVCPYRHDPLGIELTRINYDKKLTTDASSDNDTFMLNIETVASETIEVDTVTYNVFDLYRPAYTSVTGVPHWETAFNLELSPKKSILENGQFIRSVHDYMDELKIKFESADKNKTQSTTLAGVTVTENEDIGIGSLGTRLFRPYYFTFKTQVPIDFMELLQAAPYGKVTFTYNDIPYSGYLMDGGIQPADNDKQTWKLLCAGDCDVTKLINNHG